MLRLWREREGRSQTDCAEAVGVRQSTWCDWEAGRKSPQIKSAGRVEKLTNGDVPVMAWADAEGVVELDKASGE